MSDSSNGDTGLVDEDLDANPNKRDSEKKRRDQVTVNHSVVGCDDKNHNTNLKLKMIENPQSTILI